MMTLDNLLIMAQGALMTLGISALSIFFGFIGGMVLGVLTCKRLRIVGVQEILKGYVAIIRGTPLFIQILLVYFGLPSVTGINLSPFVAGVIALGANSSAYMGEIIRSGIEALPQGQWDAAKILGYTRLQTMRSIILPQALRKIVPPLTNEFISLIKESSILMVLGVPELTKMSKDIVSRELHPMETYLVAALFYFIMTFGCSLLTKRYEEGKGREKPYAA